MRRLALAGIVLAAVALTGACSDDPNSVAAQANAGDGKGYVAGDGTVEQIAPADRSTKIRVQGKTLEGQAIDSSSYLGKVVVLNKWGSWCPPCNAEAPGLEKTSQDFAGQDVQFLGVDIRESAATGLAFQRRMKISYPSLAWDGGRRPAADEGQGERHPDDAGARPRGPAGRADLGRGHRVGRCGTWCRTSWTSSP